MAARDYAPPMPSAELARKMWRTLEPYHGLVYFTPHAASAYAALGIEGRDGYFASRAAPLGAVGPEVVIATFYNFFPALVIKVVGAKPGPAQWVIHDLGFVAPLFECALGVGLLMRRFRNAAVCGAITMHVFILIALGPWGRNFNGVIWPWNLAMIAFLWMLFPQRKDDPAARDILLARDFAFHQIVVVLLAILPALSFLNLWDHYLSSALYSANRNAGVIYFDDAVFYRLPEPMDDYVTDESPDRNSLNINDWSFDELNVPSNPEVRIYKNVARSICRLGDVELVINHKLALINSVGRTTYRCTDLIR